MNNPHDPSDDASAPQAASVTEQVDEGTPPTRRFKLGFLEAIVSLSLLVSVAGITIPMIAGQQAEARNEQALMDMQDIVDGIRQYSQDTLYLPTGNRGRTNVSWLYGPGRLPRSLNLGNISQSRPLDDVLLNASMGGSGWQGPYGDPVADPWDNAYLVNLDGLVDPRMPAWVLTAGPDGVVQTPTDALSARGDDMLLHIN
jgi:type II secretory pathway pseudopilin PulG